MARDGIGRRYMRLGLAAALSLAMAAVFASHLVDRARTCHIQRRMEISDVLGAVTEQGVLLAALREVAFERLAADERTALARSAPERAAAGVREGVAEGALSPEGSALLLDPLAPLDEFAFIARAVAERPELWGKPWPPRRGGPRRHDAAFAGDPPRPGARGGRSRPRAGPAWVTL